MYYFKEIAQGSHNLLTTQCGRVQLYGVYIPTFLVHYTCIGHYGDCTYFDVTGEPAYKNVYKL